MTSCNGYVAKNPSLIPQQVNPNTYKLQTHIVSLSVAKQNTADKKQPMEYIEFLY
ncbi:hypothetical protein PLUTE_b0074 [Pseudoalteromonas luteoviolacea DSM 6061]|nr:hypothetical protein [Pseudoalteromonas luteoviolacea DSM 6061]